MEVIVLVVVLLAAAVVAAVSFSKKKSEKKVIRVDLEETKSTVHFSDDFKEKDTASEDINHTIVTICRNSVNRKVGSSWTCPVCEVENSNSEAACKVCHNRR